MVAADVNITVTSVRIWWNRQTRYFEVVVRQLVKVQVLLSAPMLWVEQLLPPVVSLGKRDRQRAGVMRAKRSPIDDLDSKRLATSINHYYSPEDKQQSRHPVTVEIAGSAPVRTANMLR